MPVERLVNGAVPVDDSSEEEIEVTLRPKDFSGYIGQERLKNALK